MEKQWNEYQATESHKDVKSKIREQDNMQNMETYSQEIVQGNKRSLFKQNSNRVFTKEFPSGIIPNPKREM